MGRGLGDVDEYSRVNTEVDPRERIQTLRSCLLVCRDWVPKSRVELYRYIRLDNKRQAIGFMKIVMASPSLGEYVRGLGFFGSGWRGRMGTCLKHDSHTTRPLEDEILVDSHV